VKVHRAVVRDRIGERRIEAGRPQPLPAPGGDVLVVGAERAVCHRTELCVTAAPILTCESEAPMRPLSSPARENRTLGLTELAIGFVFAVAAGFLNPGEAVAGIVLGGVVVGGVASIVRIRAYARATETARPAPTEEREEPGAYAKRLTWPIGLQVVGFLLIGATAQTPGLLAGIALGTGVALLVSSRWLERWEDANKVSLLHEPGDRALYVAQPQRR
jgi:hypothetical protein